MVSLARFPALAWDPIRVAQGPSVSHARVPRSSATTILNAGIKSTTVAFWPRDGCRPGRMVAFASKPTSPSSSESDASATRGEGKPDSVIEYSGADDKPSTSNVESTKQEALTQEEIGRQIAEARKQMIASGTEDSTNSNQFWLGVLEETKMIEWPKFSYVVGTTGVVVAMIIGSSIVLLTVNALLAELSDTVFSIPAVAQVWGK